MQKKSPKIKLDNLEIKSFVTLPDHKIHKIVGRGWTDGGSCQTRGCPC